MAKRTQNDRILDYMDKFGSITQWEAMRDLGVMRLASRISEMRKAGLNILSEYETSKNRLGENIRYKKYWIAEA